MNSVRLFCFCLVITTIYARHLGVSLVGPSTHGAVIQGPGAKAALVGPDGGVVSAAVAPGYVAAAAPAPVAFHSGVGLAGLGLVGGAAYGLAPGSSLEGQYVPDYSEKLYDDGSYKGDYYDGHY